MSLISRALLLGVGVLLPAALVRCSSFGAVSGNDAPGDAGSPEGDGGADAGAPEGGGDAVAPSPRTGVACGAGDSHCAVGQKCCWPAKICAESCASVDAAGAIYECGQPSDCPPEAPLCCMSMNDCGRGSAAVGSACRAAGGCSLCAYDGGVGGANRGCDPQRSDECPEGQQCAGSYDRYSYCAPPG